MRKAALLFVVAILTPSLGLAWLAVHSLRDEEFLLLRQQSLICQRLTDAVARDIGARLAAEQQRFALLAESLAGPEPIRSAPKFDLEVRLASALAEVGFAVNVSACAIASPQPAAGVAAQKFLLDNSGFLCSQSPAEVYWNPAPSKASPIGDAAEARTLPMEGPPALLKSKAETRLVTPLNLPGAGADTNLLSKIAPGEAEFRQLIGDQSDGMIARFLQDNLKLLFWHRLQRDTNEVFGAQVNLTRLLEELQPLVQTGPDLREQVGLALLNDKAKPAAWSPNVSGTHSAIDLKRPFAATEVGDALPHWEVAAYLLNPAQLTHAAHTAQWTLGLLTSVLIGVIAAGGWLIVRGLDKELKLARLKTDFVSNVSHELKTPLTSIRMFSELLAEGRAPDPAKQRSYLEIISVEASRLTRLINNVLDFARMERGEKEYHFQPADLAEIARQAAQTFRPYLEAGGFQFQTSGDDAPLPVRGDRDALAQVIVNLLSNAEKYSNGRKEISLCLRQEDAGARAAEVRVLDRGMGVPAGSGEKIFEKFYRAHASFSSGIPGSGLGLTLARQIARAHGGDVLYEPREGGGSCFTLRLPLPPASA